MRQDGKSKGNGKADRFYKIKGILKIDLTYYFGNKRRNDIDGKIKSVLDLLEKAGAYENDSFITDLIVHKRYSKENPRLEIKL